MAPSISVVIPLYNKAPHIQNTLSSVLSQKVLPVEIIVVDDGSTDGGSDIVKGFNSLMIRLVKQPNGGVSLARNKGVDLAKGNYIAFLDADDYWFENHLDVLSELIEKYPKAGLFSTMHEIRLGGTAIRPKFAYPVGYKGLVDDFFFSFSIGLSLINSSTACVKKQNFLSIGGFPEGIQRGEDLFVWIKMAHDYEIAHASVVTAVYNRDAVNRSDQLRSFEPPGSLLILAEMLTNNEENNSSVKLLFSQIAFYTSAGMNESGDFQGCRSILTLVRKLRLWDLYLKIILLFIVPAPVLTYARRWRHKL